MGKVKERQTIYLFIWKATSTNWYYSETSKNVFNVNKSI